MGNNRFFHEQKSTEEKEIFQEIIQSISKLYWLIFQMNLTNDTCEEIAADQETYTFTGKRGCIKDILEEAREIYVASEYLSSNGSWHLARFIEKKRDPSGMVTKVLYAGSEHFAFLGFRSVDEEK